MSDLVERQAAIDAVEHITSSMSVCVNTDECHGMKRMQRQAVIELANLPSAQPEVRTQMSSADDLISRQDAIDAVMDELKRIPTSAIRAKTRIEALPSEQLAPCEFCRHNNIADDKACLMCSAERRTDEQTV